MKKNLHIVPKGKRNKNSGEGTGTKTLESDWFTEQNIDASQNDLTRNISSKSIILAPFNSTMSHPSEIEDPAKELIKDKKILRLAAKVRDVDRQYEKNNNCDVDNGVYNQFAYESESQLNPLGSNEDSDEDNYMENLSLENSSQEKTQSPK